MDVLIGAICLIVFIFIIAAISDAQSKAEFKRQEEERQKNHEIEEKRQEALRRQKEEQEKKRQEEERIQEELRIVEEHRLEEKRKAEQRLFEEKVNNARKHDPATFFRLILSQYHIDTIYADDILGIEANLPSKDTVRQINKYNYLKNDGTIKVQLDRDLPKLY